MTSALLDEALAPLRSNPTRAGILLDIDGTLSPIVEHAADARVPEATRQLLISAARHYRLVACVSGRRASEARAMVSIGAITYLGSHGAELLEAGWTEAVMDPELAEWSSRMREFMRAHDTPELRRARVRIEDKGAIAAFHWRGAPDEAGARAVVDQVGADAQAAGLSVHWGRKVMEVRPPVQIDKGAGVTALLRRHQIRAALYAGDDITDLDAFEALATLARSGELQYAMRVGVRAEDGPIEIATTADLMVDGTAGIQELLLALLT